MVAARRSTMLADRRGWVAAAALLLTGLVGSLLSKAQVPLPSSSTSAGETVVELPPTTASYRHYATEAETMLHQDVLDVWFPRAVDRQNGGFHAEFDRQWRPLPSRGKFSVFQGRMTWTAATVAARRPELRAQYLPYVLHGVAYLSQVLWDKQYGGFYWGLDDHGKVSTQFGEGKHMYGISFCVYALAAAYRVTRDPATLALAQRAFEWNEQHAHDDVNGGYYEWLTRAGEPMLARPGASTATFQYGADSPVGYKSMNTHIHLLEAYTELYGVWKDPLLCRRVEELLQIVRDKIAVQPGAMNLYFTPTWQAVPDHDSYGHDVEVTYLLEEAAEAIGEGADPRTLAVSRMLTDHALAYGWDREAGGFFRSGAFVGKPDDLLKEWWVEMEGLNALLQLHARYHLETDLYWRAFQRQWTYIQRYQVDGQYRGEYGLVRPDTQPLSGDKGSMWKAAYHETRALLNVSDRLRALADDASAAPSFHAPVASER